MNIEVERQRAPKGWGWGLIRSLRPHQWVKNLFVVAPVFFAQTFDDIPLLLRGVAAALLFSLAAGTVYLINDIIDREQDRRHPTKKHRPIAAGVLPVGHALIAATLLGGATLFGALVLEPAFALVVVIYLAMNLAYSKILKGWAFIDIGIIALGFVLRVVAGGLAVGVFLSEWLVLCTFLLASFLGLGKRRHEVAMHRAGEVEKTRKVLERYRLETLDVALFFVAGMTIAIYTIYTVTASLPDQPLRTQMTPFSSPYLPGTIPLVVLGLARFYQLAQSAEAASPTDRMLRDPVVLVTGASWVVMMMILGVV